MRILETRKRFLPFGNKDEPGDDEDVSLSDIIEFICQEIPKAWILSSIPTEVYFGQCLGRQWRDLAVLMPVRNLRSSDEAKRRRKQANKAEQYHFWYN